MSRINKSIKTEVDLCLPKADEWKKGLERGAKGCGFLLGVIKMS